jgi:hypothetical protein
MQQGSNLLHCKRQRATCCWPATCCWLAIMLLAGHHAAGWPSCCWLAIMLLAGHHGSSVASAAQGMRAGHSRSQPTQVRLDAAVHELQHVSIHVVPAEQAGRQAGRQLLTSGLPSCFASDTMKATGTSCPSRSSNAPMAMKLCTAYGPGQPAAAYGPGQPAAAYGPGQPAAAG